MYKRRAIPISFEYLFDDEKIEIEPISKPGSNVKMIHYINWD